MQDFRKSFFIIIFLLFSPIVVFTQNRINRDWYIKAENYIDRAIVDPCNKALEAEVTKHMSLPSTNKDFYELGEQEKFNNWVYVEMKPKLIKLKMAVENCKNNPPGSVNSGGGFSNNTSRPVNDPSINQQNLEAGTRQIAESVENSFKAIYQRNKIIKNNFINELNSIMSKRDAENDINPELTKANQFSAVENITKPSESDDFTNLNPEQETENQDDVPANQENLGKDSTTCDLGPTLNFYYYSVEITITNNTDSRIQVQPGMDFGCFTIGDSDMKVNIPTELCCSNYYESNPLDKDKDDKFYLNSIIEPKGATWNWNFWCNHLIPENITWNFTYDFYTENSSLDIKADKEKISAKLQIGPDGKPINNITKGLQPKGKVLFNDGKVALSYDLKLVRTCNDCYVRMVLDYPCGFHSERCKRCCHRHTHGCKGVK
jgi:hypothetical protein